MPAQKSKMNTDKCHNMAFEENRACKARTLSSPTTANKITKVDDPSDPKGKGKSRTVGVSISRSK